MVSKFKEQFHIIGSTPEGEALLEESDELQALMERYADSRDPQKERISGLRLLGAGKYSFTFAFNGELAVKISGPRTGQMSHESKEDRRPENLREQFAVLSALRNHNRLQPNDITVPEQHFVAHNPHDNFVLVQELMNGWIPLGERAEILYRDRQDEEAARAEASKWTKAMWTRVRDGLEGFELAHRINDLYSPESPKLHFGNILVPETAPLDDNTPLCVIDQPKIKDKNL